MCILWIGYEGDITRLRLFNFGKSGDLHIFITLYLTADYRRYEGRSYLHYAYS